MEANIQALKKNSREWLRAKGVAAAREFRHAKTAKVGPKGAHGFTTTPAERKAFAAVERRVKRAPKAAHAGVRLVAERDADGAKVVLEARLGAWSETLAALRGE